MLVFCMYCTYLLKQLHVVLTNPFSFTGQQIYLFSKTLLVTLW